MTVKESMRQNKHTCGECCHSWYVCDYRALALDGDLSGPDKIVKDGMNGLLACQSPESDHFGHILSKDHPACPHVGFGS